MIKDMLEFDLEKLENRGISRYKAVLMASKEARFVNDQVKLGIISTKEKPTSVSLKWLYEGRVVESEDPPQVGTYS
jgi:DNA-directed RNA polymerase subunit K/omega